MPSNAATDLDPLLLQAVQFSPSDEEENASACPPYPTPAALRPFQAAAQAALHKRLAQQDADPLCSTRLYESAERFSESAPRVLRATHAFNVSDVVCLLIAGALISVDTAQRAIAACTLRLAPRFMQRALVYRLLADADVAGAARAADSPVFGEEAWVGWRAIGDHHAAQADAPAFLALWPRYGARFQRSGIDDMRRQLVEAVSRVHGWRDALALTRHKHIGNGAHVHGMAYVALRPLAEHTPVEELDALLHSAPELATCDALDELGRLNLLVDALRASTPRRPGQDPPMLNDVLGRIIAIDPRATKLQGQRRDWLLMDCWSLIGDPATLKRVRAAIRAPMYRRELSVLAKDTPRMQAREAATGAP